MCDIEKTYNCRLFNYPNGQNVAYYKKSITTGKKKDNFTKSLEKRENETRTEEQEKHCIEESLRSTKSRIYNIARSNEWEWFITLTFDRTITDSSDYETVTKKLQNFLDNYKRRYCKDMKYLIVPELHKDGIHYHFHGLLANVDESKFIYSGHNDANGNPIYNIKNWKLGFTTATRVQDTRRVSSYITKYITKESEQYLKEKNRYYCSRNVNRAKAEKMIIDKEEFESIYSDDISYMKTVNVKEAHQQITYYELQ